MRRRIATLSVPIVLLAIHCSPASQTAVLPPAPVPLTDPGVRPAQSFASSLAPLEAAVRERIEGEPGEYAIVAIDIETGRSFGINEHLVMHAASTIKVPVLLELFRRAAADEIDLDARITVSNRFRSIADTAHYYSLSREDDSEHTLYARIGQPVSARELARLMIVRSSNLAANILIELLDVQRVQATAVRIGGDGMTVLRGVEDIPAFRAGLSNTTTARGLAGVLASIARCDVLPHAMCDEVLDILAAQEYNQMLPGGLPAGIRIAHKGGWITGIQHDGAIVMPLNSPPFVLVVLTRGAADTLAARRVAVDVARLTWDALGPDGPLRPRWPHRTAELLALHERVRVPAFPAPRLQPDELWRQLEAIADGAPAVHREEIGRSLEGRPLQLLRFGDGPIRVLLWSQMHGDETTASRALADIFNYVASHPDDARVRYWADRLTILAVPMLNPDGAVMHRRRGAHSIDINRDARSLATPEGRALKAVQERFAPDYGFNLHDQNPRNRVGSSPRLAAMALLAPPPDADATPTPAFTRAQRLTAHIARELAPLLGEHLTRFDDSYNARAFGDGMQSWGVSTVLVETGSWPRDESKHYLRTTNFAAIVSALDAIAGDALDGVDPVLYTSLPPNGRTVSDLIVRGGTLVLPGLPPYRADIAIDAAAVGGPASTQVTDVGDLLENAARDTIDATGLHVHVAPGADGVASVHPGSWPRFFIRRGADPASEIVWTVDGVAVRQHTSLP
jgi:beta-lactamase class A